MSIKSFCFFACAAIFCAGLILLFAFFRTGNDEAQDMKQLDTNYSVSFLPEETAIDRSSVGATCPSWFIIGANIMLSFLLSVVVVQDLLLCRSRIEHAEHFHFLPRHVAVSRSSG